MKKYLSILMIFLLMISFAPIARAGVVRGAIWTTDSDGSAVNFNIYRDKDDVYLNGGPNNNNGGSSLTPGYYYVKVTEPDGTLLGVSKEAVVHVTESGKFGKIYQLSKIVYVVLEGSTKPTEELGFRDATNNGGEYKVWISTVSTFDNDKTKTDNFKVKSYEVENYSINIEKFYDENANGSRDNGEDGIEGWKFTVTGPLGADVYETESDGSIKIDKLVAGDYTITEWVADQNCWKNTTNMNVPLTLSKYEQSVTVQFGNVCLGAGGGHTLGFWSNKNGAELFSTNYLKNLKLYDGKGNLVSYTYTKCDKEIFSTFKDHSAFKAWILKATATDMRYMLSAQLAAMRLNVAMSEKTPPTLGFVSRSSIVYTGEGYKEGSKLYNRFMTIGELIDAAKAELESGNRASQEYIKNALDNANNNLNFVQPAPCCAPTFTGVPVDCN
jgi:hypothetical protein